MRRGTPITPAWLANLLTEDPNLVRRASSCQFCKDQAVKSCGWCDKETCARHSYKKLGVLGHNICPNCKTIEAEVAKDPRNMNHVYNLALKHGDHPVFRKAIKNWLDVDSDLLTRGDEMAKRAGTAADSDPYGFRFDQEELAGPTQELDVSSLIGPRTAEFIKNYAVEIMKAPWPGMEHLVRAQPHIYFDYASAFADRYPVYKEHLESLRQQGISGSPTRAAPFTPVGSYSDQSKATAKFSPDARQRTATRAPEDSAEDSAEERDEWDDQIDKIAKELDDEDALPDKGFNALFKKKSTRRRPQGQDLDDLL